MIHNYIGLKERCVVTILTNITGRYVILPFTGCIRSVVATDTIVGNAGVVKRCRDPAIGRVAIIAIVATHYVVCILAERNSVVVAGGANTDNLRMVHPVRGRKQD